jgi:type IX secretion system PorP/SprF family membrane protein
VLLIFAPFERIEAQRFFVSNQYVYDLFLVNPAAAAIKTDCYSINAYYQRKWIGTSLAPTTQMLTFQKAYKSRLGIGSYAFNDRNGNHREIGIQQSLAYGVTLKKTMRNVTNLYFGLSLMGSQRSLDLTNPSSTDLIDPVLVHERRNGHGFNANAGILLRINYWQIGVSATNIFPYTNTMYTPEDEPKVPININFHIGTTFYIPEKELYFEPMFYYRRNTDNDIHSDINLKLTKLTSSPTFSIWGLIAYRRTMDKNWGNSLGLASAFGIIKDRISVGMEYQIGLTNAQTEFGSAYQLMVGYKFCRNRKFEAIPCSKDPDQMKVAGGKKKKSGRFKFWHLID